MGSNANPPTPPDGGFSFARGGSAPARQTAHLVLSDGTILDGEAVGADRPIATGEVTVTTVLTGFQEVLSDPVQDGRILAFATPQVGNTGVTPEDDEADTPRCRGVVLRELSRLRSNWRATGDLDDWLVRHDVPGIAGVDTRKLTVHLRETGPQTAAFGTGPIDELLAAARSADGLTGADLVSDRVTAPSPSDDHDADEADEVDVGGAELLVLDLGASRSLLRWIAPLGRIRMLSADTTADAIRSHRADSLVLSGGPGDPNALGEIVTTVRSLVGEIPMLGIGLGHQVLALAGGATVERLHPGHHGANHPVRDLTNGRIAVVHHDHDFTVTDPGPDLEVTHRNVVDDTVEGFHDPANRLIGIQFRPEPDPGPRASAEILGRFTDLFDGSTANDTNGGGR